MEIDPACVDQIAAMLPTAPRGLGDPATNRTFWNALANLPAFNRVVTNAENLAKHPAPALPDDLYLDFSRTGNRERAQRVIFARRERITVFTLAECLEDSGRFLRPLEDEIRAVCDERAWTYPAHDRNLDNFYGRTVEIDLRCVDVAWNFASADYLLGEKLSAETRQLIRTNLMRRIFKPYRDMVERRRPEMFWFRARHNWNSVCLAGVAGAALSLEPDQRERAWHVAVAQAYVPFFLESFTPDGYCSEGISYWNYGYGNFLMLAETIRQATSGRIDLLEDAAAAEPARYALRSEILNGVYPSISDCKPGSRPDGALVDYVARRFNFTGGQSQPFHPEKRESLYSTLAFIGNDRLPGVSKPQPSAPDSPRRTWFQNGGVLICRPAPGSPNEFAVVLKGGNNAENHNHNDVGSFSVVLGNKMLICDPGSEIYTARTFSSRRYDSQVLNSFGHAVPVVAGKLQRTGKDAQGIVRKTEFTEARDVLVLDISSAYSVPELKKLERTFVYDRSGSGSLTVSDAVQLQKPAAFETALITWGEFERVSDTEFRIRDAGQALRVNVDAGGRRLRLNSQILDEDVPTRTKPRRIGISLVDGIESATVKVIVTPD